MVFRMPSLGTLPERRHWLLVANPFRLRAASILRELRTRKLEGPAWAMDALRRKVRRVYTYGSALVNRRRRSDVTFIGITGSAGKTTTKDLSVAILSALGPCESTRDSRNEHFDVAQTVAAVTRKHRTCVVELSAGGPNYLDFSLKLVKPTIGVLTLIARDHYRAFKSLEAIAAEKGKLIGALPPDGTAILNLDDPLVRAIGDSCKCRVIWIGQGDGATLKLHAARSQFPEPLTLDVEYEGRRYEVRTRLHGTQLALSVLAALAVGVAAGVSIEVGIAQLETAVPQPGRMQIVEGEDGVIFLRDDWKAPYWSLSAPLAFLKTARAKRKVAIFGTLSDYSEKASKIYPKVAKQALASADLVIFVGPHALRAIKARRDADDGSLLAFPEIRDAASHLKMALHPGDLVLIKGSNLADHLVRLVLDRTKAVECWRERCGLSKFCDRCKELYVPSGPRVVEFAATSSPTHASTRAPLAWPHGTTATQVIVGLGNPGAEFDHTPHNAGHFALDVLAAHAGCSWQQGDDGMVADVVLNGVAVKLLKPGAWMNKCGTIVQRFLERHQSDAGHCILVHDDMDLALGDVRLKRDGGDAGHRGVRSIISSLGTGTIRRVRIGVRRPGDARQATLLVLRNFSSEDMAALAPALEKSADIIGECIAREKEIPEAAARLES